MSMMTNLTGKLTPTELQMLRLFCDGKTNAEIAAIRRVKERTVETMQNKLKCMFAPDEIRHWSNEAFIAYAKEYVLPQYAENEGGGKRRRRASCNRGRAA
jgi:hypothetical protein